jgi:hypothetical protein
VRSVFGKRAKRNLSVSRLLLLTPVLFSLFLPRSGFTFDGTKQLEVVVKKPSGAALWATNLGAQDTKLTVGAKPFDATAQERPYASDMIAAGKTVRLDDSLPPGLRHSNALFIRSREELATLVAPVDFPVHASEFYSATVRQQDGRPQAAPRWVRELGAIGKSGKNVFNTDDTGYAPAVKGQTEVDKHYVFGVGVAFEKPNSSAEFKLVGRAGQELKSLVLSSSSRVYWQSQIGEFISGTDDFPGRIEMKVLSGTAQGFLSIKNSESGELTWLPIAPFAGESSLQAQSDYEGAEINFAAHPRRGGPMLEEESSLPLQGGSGGYAYFSNGVFDSRYSSYTYNVYGAPANVCGTLHIVRNGNSQTTPGWICTNGSGQATMGPWYGSTNQTGQSIYIEWPNGTTTVGGDYKIDDASDPEILSVQTPGVSVPIPTSFNGSGSDTQWGSGFNFGFGGWSSILASFKEIKANGSSKYYDGSGYSSTSPVYFLGSSSPPAGGYSISWSVTPPPSSAHNSADTYEWCVYSNDYFYSCFNCLYFYGPR